MAFLVDISTSFFDQNQKSKFIEIFIQNERMKTSLLFSRNYQKDVEIKTKLNNM